MVVIHWLVVGPGQVDFFNYTCAACKNIYSKTPKSGKPYNKKSGLSKLRLYLGYINLKQLLSARRRK